MPAVRRRLALAAGLVALAACGTAPAPAPAWTPRVIPPHVVDGGVGYVEGQPREYYACSKHADRAGLGGFQLWKAFTLDGAPFISVNNQSWVTAQWRTLDWNAPSRNPRVEDYHYSVLWKGEAAETVSLETPVYITIDFVTSHEGVNRIRLSRRDGKPPERAVAHDFSAEIHDGFVTRYTNTDAIAVKSLLFFSIAEVLMFAGTEPVLIATAFDGKGNTVQTVELDIQELRDGVATMRELMTAFAAETKDYTRACTRDFDWKVYVTGR